MHPTTLLTCLKPCYILQRLRLKTEEEEAEEDEAGEDEETEEDEEAEEAEEIEEEEENEEGLQEEEDGEEDSSEKGRNANNYTYFNENQITVLFIST